MTQVVAAVAVAAVMTVTAVVAIAEVAALTCYECAPLLMNDSFLCNCMIEWLNGNTLTLILTCPIIKC